MAARDTAAILLICTMPIAGAAAQDRDGLAAPTLPAATAQADAKKPLGLEAMVHAARADAARRTGMAAETLELLSVDRVTWRDGSLGCPQPGMSYTMALMPGYRIRLRASGQLLDYHASVRGALLLCPADRSVEPLPVDHRV